jgi:hypothetical protein
VVQLEERMHQVILVVSAREISDPDSEQIREVGPSPESVLFTQLLACVCDLIWRYGV